MKIIQIEVNQKGMETQVYRSLGGVFSCELVSSWSLTGV